MSTGVDLAGLRVLLPRPYRESDTFADHLIAQGCHVEKLPVLNIVPLLDDEKERVAFCADVSRHRHIVFVSINAVQITRDLLAASGYQFAHDVTFYAVGSATAHALNDLARPVVYPRKDATSEGLLREPVLARVAGERFMICRGRDGRNTLRKALAERGAIVTCRDIYAREPSATHLGEIRELLRGGRVDAVAIHSGAVFEALWQMLDGDSQLLLRRLPFLVPGDRVANVLREKGCECLLIADSALTADMTAALIHWYTRTGRRSAT